MVFTENICDNGNMKQMITFHSLLNVTLGSHHISRISLSPLKKAYLREIRAKKTLRYMWYFFYPTQFSEFNKAYRDTVMS